MQHQLYLQPLGAQNVSLKNRKTVGQVGLAPNLSPVPWAIQELGGEVRGNPWENQCLHEGLLQADKRVVQKLFPRASSDRGDGRGRIMRYKTPQLPPLLKRSGKEDNQSHEDPWGAKGQGHPYLSLRHRQERRQNKIQRDQG